MFRVIVNRSEFVAMLKPIAKQLVISKMRPEQPILRCVKLIADGIKFTASATNFDSVGGAQFHLVQIEHTGAVVVNAADLLAFASKDGSDVLTMIEQDGNLWIAGQYSSTTLPTFPVSDYPPCDDADVPAQWTNITAENWKRLDRESTYATAKENSRYSYKSLHVTLNGCAKVMATDGRRAVVVVAPTDGEVTEVSALLPLSACKLVSALVPKGGTIALGIIPPSEKLRESDNEPETPARFVFVVADSKGNSIATVRTNATEGTFPSIKDVMPGESTTTLKMSREEFIKAITAGSASADAESRGCVLDIEPNKPVKISSSGGGGTSQSALYANIDGAPLRIAFNPLFLIEPLKALKCDEVSLALTAADRAGVLTAGPSFSYLVMPVNLA